MVGMSKVGNDCCNRVAFYHMQDITLADALASELARIAIISYLHHTSTDVAGVTREKALHVVAINWQTSVKPELTADWTQTPQVPKADLALWRDIRTILSPNH